MLVARKASGHVTKCIFNQIEANVVEIQPKNHQNVQKNAFFAKAPGVNGLKYTCNHIQLGLNLLDQIYPANLLVSNIHVHLHVHVCNFTHTQQAVPTQ